MNEIAIRAATPEDLPYVFGTWLNHYHSNSYFAKRIRNGVYFHYHHLIAERILGRTETAVSLAVLAEEPAVILGYLVHEKTPQEQVVHFIFVKRPWQMLGIARQLITAAGLPSDLAGVAYTHPTYLWWQQLEAKFPKSVYNPYLV